MNQDFEKRYIDARRKYIEKEFSFLNPEQRKAVMTTEGPLLLLAGAGSGKTTVLINRIVNLIKYGSGSDSFCIPENAGEYELAALEEGREEAAKFAAYEPCEPWRIIAITFTNKAAEELKSRLVAALGDEADEIWAQTFHSACVRILRRDADKIAYSKNFTIYDTNDSQRVIKGIIKDFDLDEKMFPVRAVLSKISKAKDSAMSPDDFLASAKGSYDVRLSKIGEIYAEYSKRLYSADAMDFDDLILNAVKLLQSNDEIRGYYQRKFKYVLIDEYQDTNNMQYLLASLLAGGHENICVVGDDDQSIYKFRGATIKNILDFEKQYKKAKVIKLEQNYRSTGHILGAANSVISHNEGRKGKTLWTSSEDGQKPYLHVAYNEHAEAQFVAEKILENYGSGSKWSDHAVLYRVNAQSNQIEQAFKRNGIPYRIYGGIKFFDRAEVKDILAYLQVILNPNDDLRLLRIINTPVRGIGATSIEKAQNIAQKEGLHLFDVIKNARNYPELQRSAIKLVQFSDIILDLRAAAESTPLADLFDLLIEQSGYLAALNEKNIPENQSKIENIYELKSNILSFANETGDYTLHGFLDEVALYTDLDNMDRDADCVVMMTIHSAKGLEFPCVFLVGTEEGLFPGIRAIGEQEELEEERRLCYVAITRARKQLFITCAQQRMLFGRTSSNRISRFVEEISPDNIEKGYVPSGWNYSDAPRGYENVSQNVKSKPVVHGIASPAKSATVSNHIVLSQGDMVEHRSFGRGMVVSSTPMGGDHLVEIAFDKVGTKRLLLKAAAKMITKL